MVKWVDVYQTVAVLGILSDQNNPRFSVLIQQKLRGIPKAIVAKTFGTSVVEAENVIVQLHIDLLPSLVRYWAL